MRWAHQHIVVAAAAAVAVAVAAASAGVGETHSGCGPTQTLHTPSSWLGSCAGCSTPRWPPRVTTHKHTHTHTHTHTPPCLSTHTSRSCPVQAATTEKQQHTTTRTQPQRQRESERGEETERRKTAEDRGDTHTLPQRSLRSKLPCLSIGDRNHVMWSGGCRVEQQKGCWILQNRIEISFTMPPR